MKCTNCNRVVQPVVAIDIDGTLGNYHEHFLRFAADYLNHEPRFPLRNYHGGDSFKAWFLEKWEVDERTWQDIKLTYRQGAQKRTMPVFPDAANLCQSIKGLQAELWLTTTRPYLRHDSIDPDTREWLRRHRIPYDHMIYDEHKYAKLAGIVGKERVCAVLDDLKEELWEAEKCFGPEVPILRHTLYNSDVEHNPSVSSLAMAYNIIYEKIRTWRLEYQ